jgi:hypothetical protein
MGANLDPQLGHVNVIVLSSQEAASTGTAAWKFDNQPRHLIASIHRLAQRPATPHCVGVYLLGHKSQRITEKHYSPWVRTRQDALDREVLKVISN